MTSQRLIAIGLLACLCATIGCARRSANQMQYDEAPMELRTMGSPGMATGEAMMPEAPPATDAAFAPSDGEASGGGSGNSLNRVQASATDRFRIMTANLTLEVADPVATAAKIEALVKTLQGEESNSSETMDYYERKMVTMQVRVPVASFEDALKQMSALGKVLDRSTQAQDVTEDYVDTQSSLRNLKATEERLLDHLSGSKRLSDTLEVEREITRIRGEIERMEGHLRVLSHRIDYSTINLTLQEEASPEKLTPGPKYSTGREASAAARSLIEFTQGIWSLVIWVGIWGILWLPAYLWIRSLVRRRRARRDAAL